ncbi:YcjX family protein [Rheinheimera sp.]|uniref:YcjX family protein n=1 Tax=Rheinheimera sp. TaxID=1869214 RepID=UPI0027BADE7B|nr:YcjX family protein [Rheinheimera sp.]
MQIWQEFQQQSQQLTKRVFNRHLRLGVTGLSGAGKTAFITSLVNQLTAPVDTVRLPFFSPLQQQRFLGGRIDTSQAMQTPRFSYESNLQQIQQGQWPASTSSWSQLSLNLRYKPAGGLAAQLTDYRELQLDVVDYPGEWLLDLPMLQQDYQSWCQFSWQLFEKPHRAELAAEFAAYLQQVDLDDDSELQLQQLTNTYSALLQKFRLQSHACLLQPGRLLLPAELAGTPLLQLLPLLPSQLQQPSKLLSRLQQHYASYQKLVITPFYQQYFAGIDHQVVLVDCLSALNAGYDVLQELQQALMLILQSFHYGPTGWWRRLFKPRISKVLFAASKADQLTPEQHKNLTLLLQQLLQQPLQDSRYQYCQSEAMALSAVVCSDIGQVQTAEGLQACLQGISAQSGELITLYPGEVPWSMPSPLLFSHHRFAFPAFLPRPIPKQQVLPQLRLDQALEFLLGDHLT